MQGDPYGLPMLRRSWDRGVRRGERLTDLAPELHACFDKRNRLRREAGAVGLSDQVRDEKRKLFDDAALEAEDALMTFLREVGQSIDRRMAGGPSTWKLRAGPIAGGKHTWQTDRRSTPEMYFEEKLAELELRQAFSIKSPARGNVTEALKLVLADGSPKVVYRTDIRNCYESIPQERLLSLVRSNNKVPRIVVNQCEVLLQEFQALSSSDHGVPRGVGISSTLAEVYLQQIDEAIKRRINPLFYARFVDDIIVVVNPRYGNDVAKAVREVVRSIGLALKPSKTSKVHHDKPRSIDFLGYRYAWSKDGLVVRLTDRRFDRIVERLEQSYQAHAGSGSRARDDLLIKRTTMLASNYRLTNNKRNALAGIYFSNPLLDDPLMQLTKLDALKDRLVSTSGVSQKVARVLKEVSFEAGFRRRNFVGFSAEEFRRVTAVWRHVEN